MHCETDEGCKHTLCSPAYLPAAGFSSPPSKPTSISDGKSEGVEKILELNDVGGRKAAISTSDSDRNLTVLKKQPTPCNVKSLGNITVVKDMYRQISSSAMMSQHQRKHHHVDNNNGKREQNSRITQSPKLLCILLSDKKIYCEKLYVVVNLMEHDVTVNKMMMK
eukprot:9560522-Ditylum_brightwellii.AAC.1